MQFKPLLILLALSSLAAAQCDREGYSRFGGGRGGLSRFAAMCDREGYHCVGRGCGEPSSCCGGLRCMRDDGSCAGNGLIGT
ncbi:hypothetical protein BGZ88_010812, partial [Linnemannia elongata]